MGSLRPISSTIRGFATVSPVIQSRSHKVVVVGGGSAGIALSHQLLRSGQFKQDDIALIDPAEYHHYQPGWTLVGGGLKKKEDLRRPLKSLVHPKFKFYNTAVGAFQPEQNTVTLENGDSLNYEQLVVVPGIGLDYGSVQGLSEALADPHAPISTIYDYAYCDKAFKNICDFKGGNALFTQPAGIVKCAGAPQKIMWLALDYWKNAGLYNADSSTSSPINITFATGLPSMFGVPKYASKLNDLRIQRNVTGLFNHDLISINGNTATFSVSSGSGSSSSNSATTTITQPFSLLHVSPKNRPHAFLRHSPLVNPSGYVTVSPSTTQHQTYPNIWSIGDASSLPTSKTVAAITAQAPVLVSNLLSALANKECVATYDGYTSCPLLTGENKVLLAEFMYEGVPKETFGRWLGVDQVEPRRAFYWLKKEVFPWVYGKWHVKGRWGGPRGVLR